MTVPAASASITSTIKVNTRVEDLPAKLVGSGYVVILIGLVLRLGRLDRLWRLFKELFR
jgi:hypothetical protein